MHCLLCAFPNLQATESNQLFNHLTDDQWKQECHFFIFHKFAGIFAVKEMNLIHFGMRVLYGVSEVLRILYRCIICTFSFGALRPGRVAETFHVCTRLHVLVSHSTDSVIRSAV